MLIAASKLEPLPNSIKLQRVCLDVTVTGIQSFATMIQAACIRTTDLKNDSFT